MSLQTIPDVGCVRIAYPAGVVDSGASIAPACSLQNFGSQTATYPVRMRIGSSYNMTGLAVNHVPGSPIVVTFPRFSGFPRGGPYSVTCSTELAGDVQSSNDRTSGTFMVQARDLGCRALMIPTGTQDSGVSAVPACTVYNYGSITESYEVRMRIGTRYEQVVPVTGHAALSARYITFPVWLPVERGALSVRCSTVAAADCNPFNDQATGTVFVRVNDLGVFGITAPSGTVDSGVGRTPIARIRNFGNVDATCDIGFSVSDGYLGVVARTVAAGAESLFGFPDWTPKARGANSLKCSTRLAGDMVPGNDRAAGAVTVAVHDVAVIEIVAPSGTIAPGPVAPQAKLCNLGTQREPTAIVFRVSSTPPYQRSLVCGNGLPLGTDTIITFATWNAALGSFATRCSIYTMTEQVHVNDTLGGTVLVSGSGQNPYWARRADMPLGSGNRVVKDGGCLAYDDDNGADVIYGLKGNGRCEFYRFNTATNTWVTKESIPAVGSSGRKKAVKKGAAMTQAAGRLYAAKGGGTLEWWQYDPAKSGTPTYPWAQKTDIPAAAKTVKEGTGAAAVTVGDTAFVYFLRGSGGQEFLRYNTLTNVWTAMSPAPLGASGKPYKDGSCVAASEDGSTVFALKGSYDEFFAYSVNSNAWTTKAPLPLTGSSGKKKKVKTGAGLACLGGKVWAIKGGSTFEFWSYNPVADAWSQKENVPTGGGKPVKGGGALAATPSELYALKGNATVEFYLYFPGSVVSSRPPEPVPGVMAAGTVRAEADGLVVSPNPCRRRATISFSLPRSESYSLKLYDITGKLVAALCDGQANRASVLRLQVPSLPCGLYLLRLESGGSVLTRKLIIE